jgi:hypothetical protein
LIVVNDILNYDFWKDIWEAWAEHMDKEGKGKIIQLMNSKLRSKIPKLYDNVPLPSVGRQLYEL